MSSVAMLAMALGVGACSSTQSTDPSVENEVSSSEVQDEENVMLGNDDAVTSEISSENIPSETADENAATTSDEAAAENNSSEGMAIGSPSSSQEWRGSLKSQYEPGMTEWTVSRGESLSLIAEAVYGNARDWKKLQELNPSITDADLIVAGQKLRLPGSDDSARVAKVGSNTGAPSETITTDTAASVDTTTPPTVSNDAAVPAETAPNDAAAAVAMGTVETPTEVAPPSAAPSDTGALSSLIKRVDVSGNKMKMRNLLLGVAAFFLLLSGLIFILSRRKSKVS